MGLLQSFLGGNANTLYKQGMEKAKKRDFKGAIEDYTTIIDMAKTPADVKAMAQFNRALAYSSTGDYNNATQDLENLLSEDVAPPNVKTAAEEKLTRYRRLVRKRSSTSADDARIIGEFAEFMSKTSSDLFISDASLLPHPRETICEAIQRRIDDLKEPDGSDGPILQALNEAKAYLLSFQTIDPDDADMVLEINQRMASTNANEPTAKEEQSFRDLALKLQAKYARRRAIEERRMSARK